MKHPLLFGLSLLLTASFLIAAEPAAEPLKPGNVLSPAEALTRLQAGNGRYVSGKSTRVDFAESRAALAEGQNPYAIILGCADSRVAPELAFDEARGDLFVVRVAGNFVNDDNLASIEFAVKVLGAPLTVVLGHERCGAIQAAIHVVQDNAELPGHLPGLIDSLRPAVLAAQSDDGDLLTNAIRENVKLNVEKLEQATPIIKEAVQSGSVKIVGAIYNLETGKITFL